MGEYGKVNTYNATREFLHSTSLHTSPDCKSSLTEGYAFKVEAEAPERYLHRVGRYGESCLLNCRP